MSEGKHEFGLASDTHFRKIKGCAVSVSQKALCGGCGTESPKRVPYATFSVTGAARLFYFPEKAQILCGRKFLERKNIPS